MEGITNFVSSESSSSVASLVLNFDIDVIGRTVANLTVNDFAHNYCGTNWGYNGPGVITRALQKICNTNLVSSNNEFTVLKLQLILAFFDEWIRI